MNKNALIVVGLIVLVGAVWFLFQGYFSAPTVPETQESETQNEEPINTEDESVSDEPIIVYDGSAFTPNELIVDMGTTVVFQNQSNGDMWVASALHPTHTVYPESDISKCGTDEEEGIFDACGGIAPGESWEFTFNEAGEWGYHDHLNAKAFGKIIVVSAE